MKTGPILSIAGCALLIIACQPVDGNAQKADKKPMQMIEKNDVGTSEYQKNIL